MKSIIDLRALCFYAAQCNYYYINFCEPPLHLPTAIGDFFLVWLIILLASFKLILNNIILSGDQNCIDFEKIFASICVSSEIEKQSGLTELRGEWLEHYSSLIKL